MNEDPNFPPLFQGMGVTGTQDPFTEACVQAKIGCDAGLVVHNIDLDALRAAIVFAPEMPLVQATGAMIACGIGLQNALGALAPPEVAVHLEWGGAVRVNGARCGRLRIAADRSNPQEPAWLVVGLEMPLAPPPDAVMGDAPDRTYLYEEGCGDVGAVTLLEAWVRHSLVWLTRMEDDGPRPLHDTWRGLAHGIGDACTLTLNGEECSGTFLGVDEDFGMLLRSATQTHLLPLTRLLESQS